MQIKDLEEEITNLKARIAALEVRAPTIQWWPYYVPPPLPIAPLYPYPFNPLPLPYWYASQNTCNPVPFLSYQATMTGDSVAING